MLSEDSHLTNISNLIQHHVHSGSIEDESKAIARELLTSETDIFHVGPVFEDIMEDILAGSDQPYPIMSPPSPPAIEYCDGSESETDSDSEEVSDSSIVIPRIRRRDSIIAAEQVTKPAEEEAKQVATEEEQTAAQKVFDTYELLENILLKVNIHEERLTNDPSAVRTVFFAQRVNKTFLHVINRSTRLQTLLFFTYRPSRSSSASPTFLEWNPLLTHPAVHLEHRHGCRELERTCRINISVAGFDHSMIMPVPTSFRRTEILGKQKPVQEHWRKMVLWQGGGIRWACLAEVTALGKEKWICKRLFIGQKTTMGQLWDKIKTQRQWTLQ